MLRLQLFFDWIWVNLPPYLLILPFNLYLGVWGMTMSVEDLVCARLVFLSLVSGQIIPTFPEMQMRNANEKCKFLSLRQLICKLGGAQ